MSTSGIGSDLVWVYLDGGVWWPGALRQRSDLFQSSLADLRIVDLFGTNEAIAVDTSNSHAVHQYDTRLSPQSFLELHETQTIAENMQELYSCGLSHLRIRIDAMIDCQISKDECTTTVANVCAKRKDVILWDDYFLAVAFLSAMRSKDPSTQVGACIVNSRNRIVGIGYNGFPRGCSDDILPWAREAEDSLDTKYPYVCHAEVNAILNKNSADLENCKLYVALFPCNECAKMIIQSGITEIVYLSDKYRHTNSMRASRRMLDMAGVVLRQYTPEKGSISVNFRAIDKPPITLSEK